MRATCGVSSDKDLKRLALFLLFTTACALAAEARALPAAASPWPVPVSNVESSSVSPTSLPKGTILYVRLKTAVGTTSSKIHQKVAAEIVRQVFINGKVAVPLGAQLTGEINKLHSSLTPDDPALMGIDFTQMELSGEKPVKISCHLLKIENAREAVLKDGTIQGVVASDLGSTYVDKALSKLAQQLPSLSNAIQGFEKKQIGTPDTAISYAAGTDMQIALDKPLPVEKFFAPAAADRLSPPLLEAIQKVLANAPQRSSTQKGTPGDPLNIVLVGSEQEIYRAFQLAGWDVPAAQQTQSIARTVQAVVQGQGYGVAPISNFYLYGRAQDMAFEKVLNTFAMRHHLRLWRAPIAVPDGVPIWLGAAVHDTGFDIHPGVASHATSPDLDAERAKVGADLLATGFVNAEQLVTPPHPLRNGVTGTGGPWQTDGKLLVIDLK